MDTVAPSCPLRWYFSVLWRMAELCFEDEGGVEALGHPSHSWSGASMTWRVKEAGRNQKHHDLEADQARLWILEKFHLGLLGQDARSFAGGFLSWTSGTSTCATRRQPVALPAWQFYSRRVNCGAGQRLHKVHVNNNQVMRTYRLRQANLTEDQGSPAIWSMIWGKTKAPG